MVDRKIVKLRFRSALHLGADVPGIGIEASRYIAHADTLFSCLINAYVELHSGDSSAIQKLLEPFCEGVPPFRISSAFPFRMLTTHNIAYYLPKPLVAPPIFYHPRRSRWAKGKYSKLVRSSALVPMDTFQPWIQGEVKRLSELEELDISGFCLSAVRPQHARDRLTDATNIYHTGLVHFTGSSGLYFIVELHNKELLDLDMFEAMLRQAGHNGLGGRRSIGNGVFNVTDKTITDLNRSWKDLFDLPEQNGFITLSVYLPEKMCGLLPIAYQLVPRRGWCYSATTPTQKKRQSIMMFGEGSVFRNPQRNGRLADVTPSTGFTAHKLYRYGFPISLPIKILENDDDLS